MAKQLDWVSFNLNGVEGADASATVTACVCESTDTSLKKTVSMNCALPGPTEDWAAWRLDQITLLKAQEGIS